MVGDEAGSSQDTRDMSAGTLGYSPIRLAAGIGAAAHAMAELARMPREDLHGTMMSYPTTASDIQYVLP